MDNEFMMEMDELMNMGEFEEVICRIQELDEDELNQEIIIMLAHCFSQCSRYREALESLEEIEDEVQFDDLSYYLELAGANFGLHKYRTAIDQARHCLEIDDKCAEAWLLLCLIYQETGDEEKLNEASENARELDEQAWDDIFGDRTGELAVYSPEEEQIVLDYINRNYGTVEITQVRRIPSGKDHPIKCVSVSAKQDFPFWTVITLGSGAFRGIEKYPDGSEKVHRVEIAAYFPVGKNLDEDTEMYEWISRIMIQFAEMIQFDNSWLGVGHTVSYGARLDDAVEYDGVVFAPSVPPVKDTEKCMLPCGEEVEFLQIIPLYEEEILYKISNGYVDLFKRLDENLGGETDVIRNERVNVCSDTGMKKWALPRSAMEDILDWDGADGCYATDRITVDNEKVGIMYRERPENKFDSGWRFLAGDEDAEYMDDIRNMDIFRLNTICNYDMDIIEYLDSPVGSAFYRNKKGEFVPMDIHPEK